jgi:hypothetical protein
MKRTFFVSAAALGLIFAACSSDDDDSPEQTIEENQPEDDEDDEDDAPGAMAGTAGAGGSSAVSAGGSDAAGGSSMVSEGGSAGAGGGTAPAAGGQGDMSFFVTSEGSGVLGGNLGGLEGADEICQGLADAAGAGDKTWRAYLSTDTVDAATRIGEGPWFNQAGVQIAASLDELHAAGTVFNGDPNLILDENGQNAPAAQHDILTGSNADGTAAVGLNCDNWTSDSADLTENPRVGHSDIPGNPMFSPSWNAAHEAANCSEDGLTQRGGNGRLYCFAID